MVILTWSAGLPMVWIGPTTGQYVMSSTCDGQNDFLLPRVDSIIFYSTLAQMFSSSYPLLKHHVVQTEAIVDCKLIYNKNLPRITSSRFTPLHFSLPTYIHFHSDLFVCILRLFLFGLFYFQLSLVWLVESGMREESFNQRAHFCPRMSQPSLSPQDEKSSKKEPKTRIVCLENMCEISFHKTFM